MIAKYISLETVIMFFWGLLMVVLSLFFSEYVRYYLYASILVVTPLLIMKLLKIRKEDQIHQTKQFRVVIFNVIVAFMILGFLFVFIQNKS